MKKRNPFHTLSPYFFSGLLDDPLLFIRIPPPRENLLVDCGQMHHLAKRTLKSVGALFISHAHMDHFIGIDKFTRSILVSPKTIDLFGPPGIASKLAAKLSGYDWNLVEHFYCRYKVHEIGEHLISEYSLAGSDGFRLQFLGSHPRDGCLLMENRSVRVEGCLCDHKIPTLIFRFSEKPQFLIDETRIQERGFQKGPWIRDLKHYYYRGSLPGSVLEVDRPNGQPPVVIEENRATDFYSEIRRDQEVASIGYLTDVGFSEDNLDRIRSLFNGVTFLVSECTYLAAEVRKARRSYHLCTADLNLMMHELQPSWVLPIHLSKTYLGKTHLLYEELDPPDGCQLIRLPDRVTPEPISPLDTPDLLLRAEQRN